MAKGDILKFKEVTKLNIHECLTYLNFETDKNRVEREMIKQNFK